VSGQRICRLAEQASSATVPGEALRLVRALRDEINDFERQQVARALTAGEPVSAVARALGVSRQSAHRRFRDLVPPRTRARRSRPTPEARLVVEYARREAREAAVGAVGSEHLLLGMLRAGDDQTLTELGVTFDAAQSAARAVSAQGRDRAEVGQEVRLALAEAAQRARRAGADRVGLEHILFGALSDPAGGATAVLHALGVTPDAVTAAVAKRA